MFHIQHTVDVIDFDTLVIVVNIIIIKNFEKLFVFDVLFKQKVEVNKILLKQEISFDIKIH